MNDPYEQLRVSPDPALAEDLRQRLHARLEDSSLDATASSRLRAVASPGSGEAFHPMEERHMTEQSAAAVQTTRWRNMAVAAAAAVVVVVGVGAIAVMGSNSNSDDPEG